jgi:hypothetical protein
MLLVLFREVVISTGYINILRLHTFGELFQYLQENQGHCVAALTTWNGTLAFYCKVEEVARVG